MSFNIFIDSQEVQGYKLDGSHTRCRQKGASAGYQARKKAVTTNSIFLCDNKGQIIAMGSPKAGNHNDLYEIEEVLKEILALLEEAGSLF